MKVRICIPHYFKPSDNQSGYGSTRQTPRITRVLSLGRCLGSLLNLQRSQRNCLFSMADQAIDHFGLEPTQPAIEPLKLEITVCTDGKNELSEVLHEYRDFIQVKRFELDDPRKLPIATRDWLLKGDQNDDDDLYAYLEDDIVINDRDFFDKQLWFLERTEGSHCLMPHRYELIFRRNVGRLLIDGPLRPKLVRKFSTPQSNVARGSYRGIVSIAFDIPENPHSGMFVVSRDQKDILANQELPCDGFISPLETAATLTVLNSFKVCKPSIDCYDFLTVEHGHASFTSFMNKWQHRPMQAVSTTQSET